MVNRKNGNGNQLVQTGFASVDPTLSEHFRTPINKRSTPLDLIYTLQGADATCCLAINAGLRYGIQSRSFSLCGNVERFSGRHAVTFIDNEYTKYEHAVHLAVVKQFRPKYATVRDIFTIEQCEEKGIEYFSLEQILDWAEELSEHAQNVIVIPKYDCIDRIPAKFMLGYSIPTSHGGTPMPVQAFKGRRVHLLGGNWRRQLNYLSELGNDVVSIDNNHCQLIAQHRGFYTSEGDEMILSDFLDMDVSNPRYVAVALSFGSMVFKLNQLYAAGQLGSLIIEDTDSTVPAKRSKRTDEKGQAFQEFDLPLADPRDQPSAYALTRKMLQDLFTTEAPEAQGTASLAQMLTEAAQNAEAVLPSLPNTKLLPKFKPAAHKILPQWRRK